MEDQGSAEYSPERLHTIPTHLMTVDIVLSLGEFSLSSRQFLLLLLGGSLGAALWTRTAELVVWLPPLGVVLHWTLLFLLVAAVLLLTFGQAQGRSLESWLLIIAGYLARPRLYLWRSLRQHPAWPLPLSSKGLAVRSAHQPSRSEEGKESVA